MINSTLQWLGTTALLAMYIIMNFFPELHVWSIVAGLCGGLLYLTWSLRVRNRAQVLVNLAGVLVCTAGLYRIFG